MDCSASGWYSLFLMAVVRSAVSGEAVYGVLCVLLKIGSTGIFVMGILSFHFKLGTGDNE